MMQVIQLLDQDQNVACELDVLVSHTNQWIEIEADQPIAIIPLSEIKFRIVPLDCAEGLTNHSSRNAQSGA